MATVTSNVVQVSVIDEAGYVKSFNLDNPKEDLTLNQIKQAFSIPIAGRWWFGRTGSPIINIQSAQYTQTIKTQIEGETVEITPATASISITTNETKTQNFTVTGGTIQIAQTVFSSGPNTFNNNISSVNTTQKDEIITVTIIASSSIYTDGGSDTYILNLNVLVNGTLITIPITVIRS